MNNMDYNTFSMMLAESETFRKFVYNEMNKPKGDNRLPKIGWMDEGLRQVFPNKIAMIKLVRENLGYGLKDAKDYVEQHYPECSFQLTNKNN